MEYFMKRHAYLIMAHTQPELLKRLMNLLDDERNDLYIHIDSRAVDYPLEELAGEVKNAGCVFTERSEVVWGTYSQINCEMILLKEAVKKEHAYYHLLSGMDLPIKTSEEIFDFFERYDGLEFIDEDSAVISEAALDRIRYKHHFFGKAGSIRDLLGAVETRCQKLLKIDRTEKYKNILFQKGRNWFSITHGLAKYTVEKESWIREIFADSVCGDELFLQTVARNSRYAEKICNPNTMPKIPDSRYIDWKRGCNNNPYIFRETDYEELRSAEALFARKFDLTVDEKIVERLYMDLKGSV